MGVDGAQAAGDFAPWPGLSPPIRVQSKLSLVRIALGIQRQKGLPFPTMEFFGARFHQ
jgi:hypothetical protein